MRLRLCRSGRKALDFVRRFICPLPAYTSITAEYSYFHVYRTFIQPSIEYLGKKCANKEPYYRLCSLIFDEIKTTKVAQLDRKIDAIVGPGSQANVFQIRFYAKQPGDESDMTMPVYCDLDMTTTPEVLFHIIGQLETRITAIVKSITCDMHPKNQSLYRGLGVSANRPYIISPNFHSRKIYAIFDWIHIMKNLCFALMDHAVCFKSVGMFVSKQDYMDLLEKTGSEISPGYRFELHIQTDLHSNTYVKVV